MAKAPSKDTPDQPPPKNIIIGPGEVHFRIESETRKPAHRQPARDRIRAVLKEVFPPDGRVPDNFTEGDLAMVLGTGRLRVSAGVAGIYNRSSYDREVRAALALWADHVLALAEGRGRKIVALRAG